MGDFDPEKKPAAVMRPRNDAVLNTGLSSAVERRIDAKNAERRKQKEAQRNELTPGAEVILEWIGKEKADVKDLEKVILNIDFGKLRQLIPLSKQLDVTDAQLLQAQIIARMMYLEMLESMTLRVKNVLRKAKKEDEAAQKKEAEHAAA